MDRIAAEKSRDKNEDTFADTLNAMSVAPEDRQNIVGLFTESGSTCPAWTENTYVACDCEANSLPDRNAKIVWRSSCGVMALEEYSGASFDAVAQLDCTKKPAFEAQLRRQLQGSGAEGSFSYAALAWNRWSSSTGCKGSPIPSAEPIATLSETPLTCSADDIPIPDMEIPSKRGELTCADGQRKSFQIELKMGFIFKITDSEGRVSTYNASWNKDPETGAYLLDPEFVAGAVCHIQADPTMIKRLNVFVRDYVDERFRNQDRLVPRGRAACIGVRG